MLGHMLGTLSKGLPLIVSQIGARVDLHFFTINFCVYTKISLSEHPKFSPYKRPNLKIMTRQNQRHFFIIKKMHPAYKHGL